MPSRKRAIAALLAIAAAVLAIVLSHGASPPPNHQPSQGSPVGCAPIVPAHAGVCTPRQPGVTPPAAEASVIQAPALSAPKAALAAVALRGPDVSSYQPNVNWAAVKASRAFAFVKASEGRSYVDPTFARNWAIVRSLHLIHGAYDFARPAVGWTGAQEAYHFYSVVHSAGGFDSLPPVLDVEASQLSPGVTHAWVQQYLVTMVHLTHREQLVYTGAWFWNPHVGGSVNARLWVSGYAGAPPLPSGWATWTFWQYTDGRYGPSPRVTVGCGACDSSIFNGTRAQLEQLARQTHTHPAKAHKLAVWQRHLAHDRKVMHRQLVRRRRAHCNRRSSARCDRIGRSYQRRRAHAVALKRLLARG